MIRGLDAGQPTRSQQLLADIEGESRVQSKRHRYRQLRSEHESARGLPRWEPIRRDEDVLDTWFSSALWPFSTLGWPEATPDLARYYPGDVLVTGFDILFFWVARMMMMGFHFMEEVPFRDCLYPWPRARRARPENVRNPRATSSIRWS